MLRAVSGHVIIKPDGKEDNYGEIEISDGAKVRSLYGTVVSSADESVANAGDRVHIPHFAVTDMEHGGEDLVVCKIERLFLVNGRPVNGYVRVLKCAHDHVRDEDGEIELYMTDKHIDWTNWVEVLEATDGSCINDYIGYFCVAPESDERLARIGRSKEFCIHEDLIKFLVEG